MPFDLMSCLGFPFVPVFLGLCRFCGLKVLCSGAPKMRFETANMAWCSKPIKYDFLTVLTKILSFPRWYQDGHQPGSKRKDDETQR